MIQIGKGGFSFRLPKYIGEGIKALSPKNPKLRYATDAFNSHFSALSDAEKAVAMQPHSGLKVTTIRPEDFTFVNDGKQSRYASDMGLTDEDREEYARRHVDRAVKISGRPVSSLNESDYLFWLNNINGNKHVNLDYFRNEWDNFTWQDRMIAENPDYWRELKVYDNYSNAMRRHRNYTWPGFPDKLHQGWEGLKLGNSAIFGFDNTEEGGPFVASHFAPANMAEGYRLIKNAANSEVPIMFAVPNDLSTQLAKAGFSKLLSHPALFGGELVMKDVMVNDATTAEALQRYMQQYNIPQEVINEKFPIEVDGKHYMNTVKDSEENSYTIPLKEITYDNFRPKQTNFTLLNMLPDDVIANLTTKIR